MFKLKIAALVIVALYLVFSTPYNFRANAEEPILLTIEIEPSSDVDTTVFTLGYSDLVALPSVEFSTTSNWTSGVQNFTGVPLLSLLEHVGAKSGNLELVAINDYSINMPIEDPTNSGAIIAYLMNGQTMTPRDKGPLWLVYNFDSDAIYRTETIYSRSIWQLDRMVISR
ncbi:molybdopterin-dependent oxidoreductase [uncultured Roseovarius sp.]|uniref:molybdopterin-dependent oxidoreductase n=1 Tax=uncultured Roseovarius sp. TaxID=293344 RepID=UPI0026321DD3|nr:molybdopterin-dependent oxidoreductase [uncultured Roseovarius sp.]